MYSEEEYIDRIPRDIYVEKDYDDQYRSARCYVSAARERQLAEYGDVSVRGLGDTMLVRERDFKPCYYPQIYQANEHKRVLEHSTDPVIYRDDVGKQLSPPGPSRHPYPRPRTFAPRIPRYTPSHRAQSPSGARTWEFSSRYRQSRPAVRVDIRTERNENISIQTRSQGTVSGVKASEKSSDAKCIASSNIQNNKNIMNTSLEIMNTQLEIDVSNKHATTTCYEKTETKKIQAKNEAPMEKITQIASPVNAKNLNPEKYNASHLSFEPADEKISDNKSTVKKVIVIRKPNKCGTEAPDNKKSTSVNIFPSIQTETSSNNAHLKNKDIYNTEKKNSTCLEEPTSSGSQSKEQKEIVTSDVKSTIEGKLTTTRNHECDLRTSSTDIQNKTIVDSDHYNKGIEMETSTSKSRQVSTKRQENKLQLGTTDRTIESKEKENLTSLQRKLAVLSKNEEIVKLNNPSHRQTNANNIYKELEGSQEVQEIGSRKNNKEDVCKIETKVDKFNVKIDDEKTLTRGKDDNANIDIVQELEEVISVIDNTFTLPDAQHNEYLNKEDSIKKATKKDIRINLIRLILPQSPLASRTSIKECQKGGEKEKGFNNSGSNTVKTVISANNTDESRDNEIPFPVVSDKSTPKSNSSKISKQVPPCSFNYSSDNGTSQETLILEDIFILEDAIKDIDNDVDEREYWSMSARITDGVNNSHAVNRKIRENGTEKTQYQPQIIEPETIEINDDSEDECTNTPLKPVIKGNIPPSIEKIEIKSPGKDKEDEKWSNSPTSIEVENALGRTQQFGDFTNLDTRMTYLYSFKRYFDDPRTMDMDISHTPSPSKNIDASNRSEPQIETDSMLNNVDATLNDIITFSHTSDDPRDTESESRLKRKDSGISCNKPDIENTKTDQSGLEVNSTKTKCDVNNQQISEDNSYLKSTEMVTAESGDFEKESTCEWTFDEQFNDDKKWQKVNEVKNTPSKVPESSKQQRDGEEEDIQSTDSTMENYFKMSENSNQSSLSRYNKNRDTERVESAPKCPSNKTSSNDKNESKHFSSNQVDADSRNKSVKLACDNAVCCDNLAEIEHIVEPQIILHNESVREKIDMRDKIDKLSNCSSCVFQSSDLQFNDVDIVLQRCKDILDKGKKAIKSTRIYRSKSCCSFTVSETIKFSLRKTKSLNDISSVGHIDSETILESLERTEGTTIVPITLNIFRDIDFNGKLKKQNKYIESNKVLDPPPTRSKDYQDEFLPGEFNILTEECTKKSSEIIVNNKHHKSQYSESGEILVDSNDQHKPKDKNDKRQDPHSTRKDIKNPKKKSKIKKINKSRHIETAHTIVANDRNEKSKNIISSQKRKMVRRLASSDDEFVALKKPAISAKVHKDEFRRKEGQKRERRRSQEQQKSIKTAKITQKNEPFQSNCSSDQKGYSKINRSQSIDSPNQAELKENSSMASTAIQTKGAPKKKYVTKAEYVKTFGRVKSPVNIALSIEPKPKSARIIQRRATFTCEADNETILRKIEKKKFREKFIFLFGDCSEDEEDLIQSINKDDVSRDNETKRKKKKRSKSEAYMEGTNLDETDKSSEVCDQILLNLVPGSSSINNLKIVENCCQSQPRERRCSCAKEKIKEPRRVRKDSPGKEFDKNAKSKLHRCNDKRESNSYTDSRGESEKCHKMQHCEESKSRSVSEERDTDKFATSVKEKVVKPVLPVQSDILNRRRTTLSSDSKSNYSYKMGKTEKGGTKYSKCEKVSSKRKLEEKPKTAHNADIKEYKATDSVHNKKELENYLAGSHKPQSEGIETQNKKTTKGVTVNARKWTKTSECLQSSISRSLELKNESPSVASSIYVSSFITSTSNSQTSTMVQSKSHSGCSIKKLKNSDRRKSAPDILNSSSETSLVIDERESFDLIYRATENEVRVSFESYHLYFPMVPSFNKITMIERVENECTDTVHICEPPELKNDSIIVQQTIEKENDDVVEVTPPIPIIDLTKQDERQSCENSPQKTLADLLLETKREIQEIAAEEGLITLYRSEERDSNAEDIQAVPASVSLTPSSSNVSNLKEETTSILLTQVPSEKGVYPEKVVPSSSANISKQKNTEQIPEIPTDAKRSKANCDTFENRVILSADSDSNHGFIANDATTTNAASTANDKQTALSNLNLENHTAVYDLLELLHDHPNNSSTVTQSASADNVVEYQNISSRVLSDISDTTPSFPHNVGNNFQGNKPVVGDKNSTCRENGPLEINTTSGLEVDERQGGPSTIDITNIRIHQEGLNIGVSNFDFKNSNRVLTPEASAHQSNSETAQAVATPLYSIQKGLLSSNQAQQQNGEHRGLPQTFSENIPFRRTQPTLVKSPQQAAQQNSQVGPPSLLNMNSSLMSNNQNSSQNSNTIRNNLDLDRHVIDLTSEDLELSSMDLKLIVEIFTRHAYFLAHLCSAQKAYVESLNKKCYYKHYFKAEISLFEKQKRARIFSQSVRLWTELQSLNIRASKNLSDAAALIVEHIMVNLANKDMPKRVTKSMVYLLLGELIKPQMAMFATVPLLKTLIRHFSFITRRLYFRSRGNFTEETRQALQSQVQEYTRLLGDSTLPPNQQTTHTTNNLSNAFPVNGQNYLNSQPNISNCSPLPPNKTLPGASILKTVSQQQVDNIRSRTSHLDIRQADMNASYITLGNNLDSPNPPNVNIVQRHTFNANQNVSTSMNISSANVPLHQQKAQTIMGDKPSLRFPASVLVRSLAHQQYLQPPIVNQADHVFTRPRLPDYVMRTNSQTVELPGGANTRSLGCTPRYLPNYDQPIRRNVYTAFARPRPPPYSHDAISFQALNSPAQESMQTITNTEFQSVSSSNQNCEQSSQSMPAVQVSHPRLIGNQLGAPISGRLQDTMWQSSRYQRDDLTNQINNIQESPRHSVRVPASYEKTIFSVSSPTDNAALQQSSFDDTRKRSENLLEELLTSSENQALFAKPTSPANENFRVKLPFTKPVTSSITTVSPVTSRMSNSMTLQQQSRSNTTSTTMGSAPISCVSSSKPTANLTIMPHQSPSSHLQTSTTMPVNTHSHSVVSQISESSSEIASNSDLTVIASTQPSTNSDLNEPVDFNHQQANDSTGSSTLSSQPSAPMQTDSQNQILLVNNTAASSRYIVGQPQTRAVLNQGLAALSSIGPPAAMLNSSVNLIQTQPSQPILNLIRSSVSSENSSSPGNKSSLYSPSPQARSPIFVAASPKKSLQTAQENLSNDFNNKSPKQVVTTNSKTLPIKTASRKRGRPVKSKNTNKSNKKTKCSKEIETVEISSDEDISVQKESGNLVISDQTTSARIIESAAVVSVDEPSAREIRNRVGDQHSTEQPQSRQESIRESQNKTCSLPITLASSFQVTTFTDLSSGTEGEQSSDLRHQPENKNISSLEFSTIPQPSTSEVSNTEANIAWDGNGIETIDLTWIDDIDNTELQREMDFVLVKQENVENEENEGLTNRVVSSPADSGIASPPVQIEENTIYTVVQSLCICGQIPNYNCACGDAWYCGQECQLDDWESHRRICHIPQETTEPTTDKQ